MLLSIAAIPQIGNVKIRPRDDNGPSWDGTCRTNFEATCYSGSHEDEEGKYEYTEAGQRNYR